ncbi:NADH dehydrogenase [ubiquinone] 1 alpha subcomplex subunit 8 [Pseudolycoriella hygida]|uniref:NADH dehydrogenase [ubiquinone] 1 alpha subcomplex subunit 8 n=1 Tax=Pseudolycoriella hygida TaxID=35572 RepID=A0A9Q0S1K7_9DIPT|nr:NADH dehydrogenase [ubiquinone] 1 alpha subcomplex subunit 8 [Pseudolycoriella hygida]
MVVTNTVDLPTEEELTVPEVNLSNASLRAGAFHLGKYCEKQNLEFMLCRQELDDPRKCIEEGKQVTSCTMNFFRMVKKTCAEEFAQYANCLDKSSPYFDYNRCRTTQGVYDKCIFDNLQIERPEYGYYCRPKVHDSPRPAPPPPEKTIYTDVPHSLPEDYPRPPAKHGSRFHYAN